MSERTREILNDLAHGRFDRLSPGDAEYLRASLAAERKDNATMATVNADLSERLAAAEREVERLKSQGQAMAEIAMQTEARRDAAERARDEAVAALRAIVDAHVRAVSEARVLARSAKELIHLSVLEEHPLIARARAVLEGQP